MRPGQEAEVPDPAPIWRPESPGLPEYVVAYDTARITEGGAVDLLARLAKIYIGPEVDFAPPLSSRPGFVMHVRPARFGGIGPWAKA